MLVSTGSQGEPLSALSRMSRGDHRQVNLEQGDTVILASSMIPGNETSVFAVINELSRLGVTVIHQGMAKVHVSGHASAGELLYLYNAVRPRNVVPVHGEWRHLRAQARLAELTGVPPARVVLAPNGTVVDLVDRIARVVGHVDVGMVYVDGNAVGDVGETTLSDRLVLGEGGFISITVAIDAQTGPCGGRADHLRPRILGQPGGPRRGRPVGGAGARVLRGGRHHRPAPGSAGGPPGGREVGVGHLSAPTDDRPDSASGPADLT